MTLKKDNWQKGFILVMFTIFSSPEQSFAQAIVPFKDNPRYWQYKGEPVMLLGANKTDSPYLLPDQKAYYDSLAVLGGNYTRYVVKQRLDEGLVHKFPFKKLDNGRYDLEQWDEEYWQRFEEGLRLTQERNIVVQLELWDRFDIGSEDSYIVSPWRPDNNITYTEQSSGLPNEWIGRDSSVAKHPFFSSLPTLDDNKLLLQYQERYIDKILSITFKYEHILYVITNESTLSLEWSDYWAKYLISKAESSNKKVEVSEMPWTLADHFPFDWQKTSLVDPNKWINHVIDHPDLYSFCAMQFQPILTSGQDHYDRLTEIYQRVQSAQGGPRPINAVKIFTRSKVIYGGTEPNKQTRYWRPLMAGWSAVSLHREHPNTEYLGFSETGQRNLSAATKFCAAIKPWECKPGQELLFNRENDEAYLLANPGKAYGIYFPGSGDIELEITPNTTYYLRWISIEIGAFFGEVKRIRPGKRIILKTPEEGSSAGWAATLTIKSE